MTLHRFSAGPAKAGSGAFRPFSLDFSFMRESGDLSDFILHARGLQSLDASAALYPIYREARCAARRPLEEIFDDLASSTGLAVLRFNAGSLLLDGTGIFVRAKGVRKKDYCSCTFDLWAQSMARLEEIRAVLFSVVGEQIVADRMFTIDWQFSGEYGLTSSTFEETAADPLHDEAYPMLGEPVSAFIARYIAAEETVLVLQGPPGTGKTRLVRGILGELSRRKGDSARVMYTSDKTVLEKDNIFVEFITGEHDAFVVEDADHLLLSRSRGNKELHRFLAVADGVVRAQGRKIIFTTNLPNVGDVDDALLRPGRCFANVRTRLLERAEAERLIQRLCTDPAAAERAAASIFTSQARASVATVYRAYAAKAK